MGNKPGLFWLYCLAPGLELQFTYKYILTKPTIAYNLFTQQPKEEYDELPLNRMKA
jgi:hypothetical protein